MYLLFLICILFFSLTSLLILGQDHLNKIPFQAFINSRSTHCFVDSKFMNIHHLKISTTPPDTLHLFDSSSNSTISEIANLPIIFPIGDCINLDFYITLLDSSYSFLQTFRPTPQILQRFLTFPMSLLSNTNLLMSSVKPKLKYLLLIILITSKSI